jgi:hypothetical protein
MERAMEWVVDIATIAGAIASVVCAWVGISSRRRQNRSDRQNHPLARLKAAEWERGHDEAIESAILRDGYVELRDAAGVRHLLLVSVELREEQERRDRERRMKRARVPPWALDLMPPDDSRRYAMEWSAHLLQLIEENAIGQARRDRRRLTFAAVVLSVALRVRRALSKSY